MTGPRFVPLTCPTCGGNLSGRAADVVACCLPCRSAWLVDGPEPRAQRVLAIDLQPDDSAGTPLVLPFWASPSVAIPAFESARPLSLARAVTRVLGDWPARTGLPDLPPLGARIAPSAAGRVARLAGLADENGPWTLLAVPARLAGTRLRIAGLDALPCYAEDLSEAPALISRLAELATSALAR